MPKQYGTGNYHADQKIALMQLIEYLKTAERGQMKALLDAIEDEDTRGAMMDFHKPHPNAVLLEAIILFVDMANGLGKPMSGYAQEMLNHFDTRQVLRVAGGGGPVWVPQRN